MKKRIFIYVFLSLLFSIAIQAEETYIVYFTDAVQTFSIGEKQRGYCSATYEELQEYLAAGIVADYELDHEVELFDVFTSVQATEWNLDAISADKAWEIGCHGQGITVGVIDSGVYPHQTLIDNIVNGYSYIDSGADTTDNIGHGTFVSGIIDSIASEVKIVPLKCFDNGKITLTRMISDAIYDAVDIYGCDVINMSFGIPESQITTTLSLAINHALKSGCIVVAAVGNDNASTVYYPANYDGVIGVGAVDANGKRSWFSQYNSSVDFMAPGEGIDGLRIDGFTADSGTSFAAPHVSALAAVAKCIDRDIDTSGFSAALEAVCRLSESYTYNVFYGHGAVNAADMIDVLLADTEIFLSPVFLENGNYTSVVYNNTDITKSLVAIAATYENSGVLADASITPYTLFSKTAQPISCAPLGKEVCIGVWKDLQTLSPYTICRQFKEEEK